MYVCTQLDATGTQCQTWTEYTPNSVFLPSIPPSDAAAISAAILMVYATIWVFNAIRRTLDL
jgi:hypothetical protein